MSRAMENLTGAAVTLDMETLAEGLRASRESSRRRIILPIQRTQEAQVQRLVNFLQPGTYIRPHCHPEPHASESICLIQGSLEVVIFSAAGKVTERHLLKETDTRLVDIEPGTWHGMLVKSNDTVIFECKRGPYDADKDKEFARWAPEEGDEAVQSYLETLLSESPRETRFFTV